MSIAIFNIIPNVVKPNASYLPNTLTPSIDVAIIKKNEPLKFIAKKDITIN